MRSRAFVMVAVLASTWLAKGPLLANWVHVAVTAPRPVPIRAIWRPHAGGRTFEEQQGAVRAAWALPGAADSARRWRDPSARDTIGAGTPAEFVIDMGGGPVVFEAMGEDSIHVEVQLRPARSQIVSAWGRALRVESDGMTPRIWVVR